MGSGPEGVTLARNDRAEEEWTLVALPPLPPAGTQPYFGAAPIDLDNDGAHDLAVLHGGALFLFRQTEEGFVPLEKDRLPELIGTLPERTIVDFAVRDWDHEGDLDLVLVLDSGAARLWRNDGFSGSDQGKFTDATVESGLPEFVRDARWVALEDFDGDNDVDLLFGTSGLILADGLRGGKFGAREFAAGRSENPLGLKSATRTAMDASTSRSRTARFPRSPPPTSTATESSTKREFKTTASTSSAARAQRKGCSR